jgi:hypothetical protein
MLDRVIVDIVNVPVQVLLVSNHMVPEPVLPDSSCGLARSLSMKHTETHLQALHYSREIILVGIQQQVKVVGQ